MMKNGSCSHLLQFTNAVAHSLYSPRPHLSSWMERKRLIVFSSDFPFDCFRGLLFFEGSSESVSLSSGDTCAGAVFSKENDRIINVTKQMKNLKYLQNEAIELYLPRLTSWAVRFEVPSSCFLHM